MKILIIAEHHQQKISAATLNTVTAARALAGGDITLLIAGYQCMAVAEQAAEIAGIKQVLVADAEIYQNALAEPLAELVVSLSSSYTHILTPATTFGKNFMPRVAALLDVAQISDIIEVVSADTFVRPIYAGNALATVQSQDSIKVITVRSTAFAAAAIGAEKAPINPVTMTAQADGKSTPSSRLLRQELTQSSRPELNAATIVVAGGRGLQSAENFKLLEALADRLGAAIGASRAAVDAGFVPNDYQVGQTGKVVAPQLYIAIGISGAIQHLAGMKDSKVIVAINKDPDAPIFQVADYGLIGDLFEILPELTTALAA